MQIPRFWVKDEGADVDPSGRQWHLTVWGWSSSSLADAAEVARDRLGQALEKVRRGERLTGGYYPRLPLREETLRRVEQNGDEVAGVTRNRYGAEVLNTDRVLIADVDRDLEPKAAALDVVREVGKRLGRLFGGKVPMAGQLEPKPQLSPEQEAVAEVSEWAARHPSYGVRVYRTFAGLRVIVTGSGAPPSSELARRILTELGSDPLYVELCTQHDTYRARLTPKPWRAGWRAPSVRWPYESQGARGEFAAWLSGYERASHDRSTCRLIATYGPQPLPGSADAAIVTLHDDVTRASDGTPLA
ncbi:MAG TPA: hypothetical protein VFL94_16830 [Actinomycetales bacterium]|nr:hypothetical protein [Actinomycetales bacterium]